MHVFHVITTLNKGGAESHLVDLCRALRERDVELTVAYLKGDSFWVPEMKAMGVTTIALNARHYADPAAVLRLVKAIRRAKPDIVHAHMPPAELYAVAALKLAGGPAYMVSKHVDRHPFYPGPAAAWMERQFARPAQSVLCISQAVNDYFAARWPDDLSAKLVTVRYGLSPHPDGAALDAKARALRAEWGVADDEILFGIAARFVAQKAIDTLIAAFAELAARSGRMVRLALVGQGELEVPLRAQAAALGLDDKVIWPGFRTDIPVVMRAFDVFVLSSIFEGFGLVLLEAMEASTPIITCNISAMPEIVIDGETGLLVPPREPSRLAAAMEQMLDRSPREAMGAAGHRRLLDVFSVDRMADSTLAIYRSLAGAAIAPGTRTPARAAGACGEATSTARPSPGLATSGSASTSRSFRRTRPETCSNATSTFFRGAACRRMPKASTSAAAAGRWAAQVAPRIGRLHCIDPSSAIEVAKRNLARLANVDFARADAEAIPLPDGSQDFGYSLGVLHHIPDTARAMRQCVAKLKPGAPFLVYLYYRFDNRPGWFRLLWQASEAGRAVVSRLPHRARYAVSQAIAGAVYWPLARAAHLGTKCGLDTGAWPLSMYQDRSFYTMRTDALDRFGTRLEQRFTAAEITAMMERAGLERIEVSPKAPYWCAVGYRAR